MVAPAAASQMIFFELRRSDNRAPPAVILKNYLMSLLVIFDPEVGSSGGVVENCFQFANTSTNFMTPFVW